MNSMSSTTRKTAQLFSDLHLEFFNGTRFPRIPPRAQYLFLAGDIGNLYKNPENFVAFFDYCSENWKKVFYVAGNHEYYFNDGSPLQRDVYSEFFGEESSRAYDNVFYLNNTAVDLDNETRIYGATLWTPPQPSPSLNDYNHMTPSDILNKSIEQRKKLREFLQENDKPAILITHFPPTQIGTSHPKFASQSIFLKNYFAWKPDLLLGDVPRKKLENVKLWCSGHTHYSYNITMGCSHGGFGPAVAIPCISNQVGYPREGDTGFDEDGIVDL